MRSSGHQSRDPSGQLLKTSFRGQCYTQGKLKDYNRLSDGAEPVRTTVLPSPLCPTRGARGHYVLQGVREGVLYERKLVVEGLWTQTLLARDVLDGWSGLRPWRRGRKVEESKTTCVNAHTSRRNLSINRESAPCRRECATSCEETFVAGIPRDVCR